MRICVTVIEYGSSLVTIADIPFRFILEKISVYQTLLIFLTIRTFVAGSMDINYYSIFNILKLFCSYNPFLLTRLLQHRLLKIVKGFYELFFTKLNIFYLYKITYNPVFSFKTLTKPRPPVRRTYYTKHNSVCGIDM